MMSARAPNSSRTGERKALGNGLTPLNPATSSRMTQLRTNMICHTDKSLMRSFAMASWMGKTKKPARPKATPSMLEPVCKLDLILEAVI